MRQAYRILPVTLYRLSIGSTSQLRQRKKQLEKGSSSFDYELGSNGLYNPSTAEKFMKPNGLVLRPIGLNLAKMFDLFKGKLVIYEIREGVTVPEQLTLWLEQADHYSLQTSKPIEPDLFQARANQFFHAQEKISRKQLMEKFISYRETS